MPQSDSALSELTNWLDDRLERFRVAVADGDIASANTIRDHFRVSHESFARVNRIIMHLRLDAAFRRSGTNNTTGELRAVTVHGLVIVSAERLSASRYLLMSSEQSRNRMERMFVYATCPIWAAVVAMETALSNSDAISNQRCYQVLSAPLSISTMVA